MLPNQFYYRLENGHVFGPYQAAEFWQFVKQNRLNDSSILAASPDGPWMQTKDFLASGGTKRFYILVDSKTLGPYSRCYIRYLEITTSAIQADTPVSFSPDGPWKLMCEFSHLNTEHTRESQPSITNAAAQITGASQRNELPYAGRVEILKWLTIVFFVVGVISSASAVKMEKDIKANRIAQKGELPELPRSLMQDLGVFAFYSGLNPFNWVTLVFLAVYWHSIACPRCRRRLGKFAPGEHVCPGCKGQFVCR